MVKGTGKSSATSGTRKKHAKKANSGQPEEIIPKEKKLKKKERGQKKKEPRIKVYIPPVKPAPAQPDPLETTGLVHTLPADLLIILRSFNKKAQVTKIRALEELQSMWIDKCRKEGEDGTAVYVLVEMLPVWLHHVSALLTHHSRRVRLLTAGIHASLLQIHPTREQICFFLQETASSPQVEMILGAWCMAAHDVDRFVAAAAYKSWNDIISTRTDPGGIGHLILDGRFRSSLITFIQRAILDPNGVHLYLNPAPPPSVPPPLKKGAMRKDNSEQATRSKSEELEENEQDRVARLRITALGALKWILETTETNPSDEMIEFFKNPVLLSSLYPGEQCPFTGMESFGFGQPNVRKASWALVQALLRVWKGGLEPLLPVLSSAVLRSAWVESDTGVHTLMWQPLLTFLKEFPNSWEVERTQEYNRPHSEDDSDSENSDNEERHREDLPNPNIAAGASPAYLEFLKFLELGCSASPLQGYPTVLIIVSTIPSSILASTVPGSPLTHLFDSFWKVLDSRALSSLQRSATSVAFLSALFECMLFLIRRIRSDPQNHGVLLGGPGTTVETGRLILDFICGQITKVWAHLVGKTLKVEQRAASRLMAQSLLSLYELDDTLFVSAWDSISEEIRRAVGQEPGLVSAFMKVFQDRFKGSTVPSEKVATLISEILTTAMEAFEASLQAETPDATILSGRADLMIHMLDQFRDSLFDDVQFSQHMDELIGRFGPILLNVSPALLLAYLSHRKEDEQCRRVWKNLLSDISQHPEDAEVSLSPLLDAAHRGSLPLYLNSSGGGLDNILRTSITQALAGESKVLFVQRVLQHPDYFLSEAGYNTSLDIIITTFILQVDLALRDDESSLDSFIVPLDLVALLLKHTPQRLPPGQFDALMPSLFIYAHLLPACHSLEEDRHTFSAADDIWKQWVRASDNIQREKVASKLKESLKRLLCDVQTRLSAQDMLRVIPQTSELGFKYPADLFPTMGELDDMLEELPHDPIHPSLSVLDHLIPPTSSFGGKTLTSPVYDRRGFSVYARVVSALLQISVEDRQIAKQNIWALRHFLALELYAQDLHRFPSGKSPVFDVKALLNLEAIVSRVEQITTYVITSYADEAWRENTLNVFLEGTPTENLGVLSKFFVDIVERSQRSDNARDSRILRKVLQHVFHDVDRPGADRWVLLARKLEKSAPQTSMSIVSVVTEFALEPPRLDRYRNELAAAFLGIRSNKANTEGLLTLRKLAACAPNLESDVVFLPQPRAVNIMKAFQQWVGSDDDIDEEVESFMTLIFLHLAPILQDVPGAHWDLIFDVLENNLENSSISDDLTLTTLSRSLRLIILLQDLALTNKSLRGDWEVRKVPILAMVRDLLIDLHDFRRSLPSSTCCELALSVVQDLPQSLIDHETLPKMSHLVLDTSLEVQKTAYRFLQTAAKKRTEYLVIEAGVDTEATVQADLPSEVLHILQHDINTDQADEEQPNLFGHLLGWMLLFDLFQDTSLKVRSSYIEQLRSLDIIVSHFIPTLLHLLRLDQGPSKIFKLDIWAIDEFYIEYYDSTASFGLPLLAAHLYYRALLTVPSLIHTWILDCKDRQLSSSITNYTSQYFSPVIIQTELAHVKSAESTALLVDENLTVKVASAVNEVVAAYLVDEHQLEIKLKIPSDWPLHKIEVKDVKRVGVDENRWRAWILAVQQIIWSHNGRIVDGLGLFKKNVTLHFEGQVECAICYSIISVMDGTLPRKPCKTCKNRFHSGCLYKWFNSSHSSSCPLCRSDIF